MPDKERLLLVEGQDDCHFVKQLWNKHFESDGSKPLFYEGSIQPFDIMSLGGVEKLCESIPTEINASNREVLGILVDANSDLENRWVKISCEIKKAIEMSGESKDIQIDLNEIPNAPKPTGTIINSKPRIGIWLMPCNVSPGELEDFVVNMVPECDPIWPDSKQYISNITMENRKFNNKKTPKAQLFAWLATRSDPGRMGAAIGAGDLSLDNEQSKTFLKWLTELFE